MRGSELDGAVVERITSCSLARRDDIFSTRDKMHRLLEDSPRVPVEVTTFRRAQIDCRRRERVVRVKVEQGERVLLCRESGGTGGDREASESEDQRVVVVVVRVEGSRGVSVLSNVRRYRRRAKST